jgi:Iodothyronine deiodinase
VAFFVIYIGEAHPSDLWQVPNNLKDQVILRSPANEKERMAVAELCVTKLAIEVPALVDHFDDATERAYTGWPERLYLVNREGRVAYKSRPGPFGFKLTDLEDALRSVVASEAASPASSPVRADTAWGALGDEQN